MQCIYFLSHILEQPKCSPGKASPFPVSQLPRVRASTPVLSAQGGVCCACGLCALSPDSPTWGAPGCWSTPARPPSTALQPSLPFQKQSLMCPGAKHPGGAGRPWPQRPPATAQTACLQAEPAKARVPYLTYHLPQQC